MATAIDTLATYDAIAASGLDQGAARAISKAIADSAAVYRADLATKADLTELGSVTRTDLAKVETSLRADLTKVETSLRADLTKVETSLRTDLARPEAKLEAKIDSGNGVLRELIATTQNKTLIWMFGMLVTFSGIIVGFIKLT
jgi:hypothetical protein